MKHRSKERQVQIRDLVKKPNISEAIFQKMKTMTQWDRCNIWRYNNRKVYKNNEQHQAIE